MAPQITISPEDSAAGGAFVRLQVSMGEKMSLEVTPLVEAPATRWTLVRGLLHVQNFMDSKSAALTETLATLNAFERLLFAVDVPGKNRVKF